MLAIRPSRPDEGERIVSIWRAAVDATHDFLVPSDRAAIDVDARAYCMAAPLWVAVDARGELIAFMGLSEARLDALFVDPQRRGRGVGQALVSFASSLHPVLDTEVNAQNGQAVGFYRKLGFIETGYSPTDDQGRPYPLIHMRLVTSAGDSQDAAGLAKWP
jgi:putative acetyltransferase